MAFDKNNNPFYPPKKESPLKEIGTTLAVVVICILLVGIIVKNFNIFAIEERKAAKGGDVSYEADTPSQEEDYDSVGDKYYEEEPMQGDEIPDAPVEEEIIIEEQVEKSASLLYGEPEESMMNYTYVPVVSAQATSTISQQDVVNTAIVAFDGLDETSWQEGVDGYGIGEGMIGYFSDPFEVDYIAFKLGNWKNDKYYYGNAKPKTLTITLGEFSQQITFTGERKVEWVKVDGGVISDSIQITINDIYPGSNWEDTCIAEIAVYGR